MAKCACGNWPVNCKKLQVHAEGVRALRETDSCKFGLPLVSSRNSSLKNPGKFEGVALAEIYAAISYALANPKEISAEVKKEDR